MNKIIGLAVLPLVAAPLVACSSGGGSAAGGTECYAAGTVDGATTWVFPNGNEAASTDASECSDIASAVNSVTGDSFSVTTSNTPGENLVPACVGDDGNGVSVTVESASSQATTDLCGALGLNPAVP